MAAENRRTLSDWLQFLLEAGIPASQAANYAVSFVENRIEKDMLGDLDKDYLKELGVTVLGDVIAILKHAEKVTAQQTKRAEIQMVRTADGVKKTTPASRLVDHFLKGNDSLQASPKVSDDEEVMMAQVPLRKAVLKSKLRTERVKISKLRSDRMARGVTSSAMSTPVARTTPVISSTPVGSSTVPRRRVASPLISDKLVEEVPVQKKRRVLPEHEGAYKIKMPEGSIPKTARLVAQGKLPAASATYTTSKGVFSRLGSTPDVAATVKTPQLQATVNKSSIIKAQSSPSNKIEFTVTGLGKVDPHNILKLSSAKEGGSLDQGVFRRLGGSSTPTARRTIKRPATSTQSDEPIALDAAPYIGVLKDGGKHAKPKSTIKLAPSASDKTGFAVSRLAKDNVRTRLGKSGTGGITRIISSSPAQTNRVAVSVKRRLGGASDSTVSSTTETHSAVRVAAKAGKISNISTPGVFSRLGSR